MSTEPAVLTVGVTTRNRPEALARCLQSIEALGGMVSRIIVIDDASDMPMREATASLAPHLQQKLTFIVQPGRLGYIVARNAIMRLSATPYVLLLDDDTYLVDGEPLRQAVRMMESHREVAAVACAQAEADGSPWPAPMQPSPVAFRCYVPAFIGFAHLLRRDVFLKLGGYRESFHYYGEEKDYCLRLWNAGHRVVYMPDALVAHVPDPSGRSSSKYLRYVVRNDCLSALYNEPLLMMMATTPARLARYFLMRRNYRISDPGGMRWIIGELVALWPDVWRDRTPVRWASVRRWRNLRRMPQALGAGLAQ